MTDGTVSGWASGDFLADAVQMAVADLIRAGIINTPGHWLRVYRDVRWLDRLLVNLSELTFSNQTGEVGTVEEAIDVLVRAGAISSPGYWRENHGRIRHLDTLLVRAASRL